MIEVFFSNYIVNNIKIGPRRAYGRIKDIGVHVVLFLTTILKFIFDVFFFLSGSIFVLKVSPTHDLVLFITTKPVAENKTTSIT